MNRGFSLQYGASNFSADVTIKFFILSVFYRIFAQMQTESFYLIYVIFIVCMLNVFILLLFNVLI